MDTAFRSTAVFLLMALVTVGLAFGQEPDLGTEAQREAGRAIYDKVCAQCHGLQGDAVAPATAHLRPQPRNFTSGTFKFRSSNSGELPSDEDLRRSIRDGMPTTSMPAWGGVLSEQEITNVAYYIKTFADDFAGPFGIPEMANLPSAPSFSAEAAERGRAIFEENQCIDCHGNLGRGDGKSAPTLTDQWDMPIRPADLTKRWTFRNGDTREDIYRTFTTGLDGSPMPSYELPEDEAWALVDYVYALSDDAPNYGTVVTSTTVDGPLDLSLGEALFDGAPMTRFPIVGQIIEPGRSFFPGTSALEVQAVHNADEIAFLLAWNDMEAQTTGTNGPGMPVGLGDSLMPDTSATFSDAVALQFPTTMPVGVERPYFMFGDAKNAVDLWFYDLAKGGPDQYVGKGSGSLQAAATTTISGTAQFHEGRWVAIIKRARMAEDGLSFAEETFVPVAFSVWDGFNRERGNKRGLTGWYNVYVEPLERPSAAGPMALWGGLTLLLGFGIAGLARRKYKDVDLDADAA